MSELKKVIKNIRQKDPNTLTSQVSSALNKNKQTNSVALICERTIPTERPPLVGEVSAIFCG
jgi:hypothetical protein